MARNWKRRYFVVRSNGSLEYYKASRITGRPKGTIPLSKATSIIGPLGSNGPDCVALWPIDSESDARFQVTTKKRTYFIFTDSYVSGNDSSRGNVSAPPNLNRIARFRTSAIVSSGLSNQ